MALLNGARLSVLRKNSDDIIREVLIRTSQIKFGSEVNCTIRLKSDLAEKQHCKIFVKNEKVFITNYSTNNPISIDGKVISKRAVLRDGCLIEMCRTRFRWNFDSELLQARTEKVKNAEKTPTSSKFGKLRRTTMFRKKQNIEQAGPSVVSNVRKSGPKKSHKTPTYTLPKNNKQLLKNIKKRATMHSVMVDHNSDDDVEIADEEHYQDGSAATVSTTNPDVTVTPKTTAVLDSSKNNTPFYTPEPEKENQTPVAISHTPKTPKNNALQLENSAMMILSYTPGAGPRSGKANIAKTPLSSVKKATQNLRSGFLTPKNDNIPTLASNLNSPNVSKVGNSMYLIDLTTPTSKNSSFVSNASHQSFASSTGLIDLVTPPSKKPKTPSSAIAKSSQKGLLRSALKNASKTPLSAPRSRYAPYTPKQAVATPLNDSASKSPKSSTKRIRTPLTPTVDFKSKNHSQMETPVMDNTIDSCYREPQTPPQGKSEHEGETETPKNSSVMTTEELFDTLVGRQSIRKTYSRKSESPNKIPIPLLPAESLSDLPKTDIDIWVESVVATVTSPEPLLAESFIKMPNRTTQVRSSQYSDITPHESFTEVPATVATDESQEKTSLHEVSTIVTENKLDIFNKPNATRTRRSHTPLASKIVRSLGNKRQTIGNFFTNMFGKLTVSPVTRVSISNENSDEADDSEVSEEEYHDSESDQLIDVVDQSKDINPSPKLRQSLRDTRKFIGNALTSLNTSKLTLDNSVDIDESLLLNETYDDNVVNQNELMDDNYDLTDLSARPETEVLSVAALHDHSKPSTSTRKSTRKVVHSDFRSEISPKDNQALQSPRIVHQTPPVGKNTRQTIDIDISPLAVPLQITPVKKSRKSVAIAEQESSTPASCEPYQSPMTAVCGTSLIDKSPTTSESMTEKGKLSVSRRSTRKSTVHKYVHNAEASADELVNRSGVSSLSIDPVDVVESVSPIKTNDTATPLRTRQSMRVSRNATVNVEQPAFAEESIQDELQTSADVCSVGHISITSAAEDNTPSFFREDTVCEDAEARNNESVHVLEIEKSTNHDDAEEVTSTRYARSYTESFKPNQSTPELVASKQSYCSRRATVSSSTPLQNHVEMKLPNHVLELQMMTPEKRITRKSLAATATNSPKVSHTTSTVMKSESNLCRENQSVQDLPARSNDSMDDDLSSSVMNTATGISAIDETNTVQLITPEINNRTYSSHSPDKKPFSADCDKEDLTNANHDSLSTLDLEGVSTEVQNADKDDHQEQSIVSEVVFTTPARQVRSSLRSSGTSIGGNNIDRLSASVGKPVKKSSNGTPLLKKAFFAMCTPSRSSGNSDSFDLRVETPVSAKHNPNTLRRSSRRSTITAKVSTGYAISNVVASAGSPTIDSEKSTEKFAGTDSSLISQTTSKIDIPLATPMLVDFEPETHVSIVEQQTNPDVGMPSKEAGNFLVDSSMIEHSLVSSAMVQNPRRISRARVSTTGARQNADPETYSQNDSTLPEVNKNIQTPAMNDVEPMLSPKTIENPMKKHMSHIQEKTARVKTPGSARKSLLIKKTEVTPDKPTSTNHSAGLLDIVSTPDYSSPARMSRRSSRKSTIVSYDAECIGSTLADEMTTMGETHSESIVEQKDASITEGDASQSFKENSVMIEYASEAANVSLTSEHTSPNTRGSRFSRRSTIGTNDSKLACDDAESDASDQLTPDVSLNKGSPRKQMEILTEDLQTSVAASPPVINTLRTRKTFSTPVAVDFKQDMTPASVKESRISSPSASKTITIMKQLSESIVEDPNKPTVNKEILSPAKKACDISKNVTELSFEDKTPVQRSFSRTSTVGAKSSPKIGISIDTPESNRKSVLATSPVQISLSEKHDVSMNEPISTPSNEDLVVSGTSDRILEVVSTPPNSRFSRASRYSKRSTIDFDNSESSISSLINRSADKSSTAVEELFESIVEQPDTQQASVSTPYKETHKTRNSADTFKDVSTIVNSPARARRSTIESKPVFCEAEPVDSNESAVSNVSFDLSPKQMEASTGNLQMSVSNSPSVKLTPGVRASSRKIATSTSSTPVSTPLQKTATSIGKPSSTSKRTTMAKKMSTSMVEQSDESMTSLNKSLEMSEDVAEYEQSIENISPDRVSSSRKSTILAMESKPVPQNVVDIDVNFHNETAVVKLQDSLTKDSEHFTPSKETSVMIEKTADASMVASTPGNTSSTRLSRSSRRSAIGKEDSSHSYRGEKPDATNELNMSAVSIDSSPAQKETSTGNLRSSLINPQSVTPRVRNVGISTVSTPVSVDFEHAVQVKTPTSVRKSLPRNHSTSKNGTMINETAESIVEQQDKCIINAEVLPSPSKHVPELNNSIVKSPATLPRKSTIESKESTPLRKDTEEQGTQQDKAVFNVSKSLQSSEQESAAALVTDSSITRRRTSQFGSPFATPLMGTSIKTPSSVRKSLLKTRSSAVSLIESKSPTLLKEQNEDLVVEQQNSMRREPEVFTPSNETARVAEDTKSQRVSRSTRRLTIASDDSVSIDANSLLINRATGKRSTNVEAFSEATVEEVSTTAPEIFTPAPEAIVVAGVTVDTSEIAVNLSTARATRSSRKSTMGTIDTTIGRLVSSEGINSSPGDLLASTTDSPMVMCTPKLRASARNLATSTVSTPVSVNLESGSQVKTPASVRKSLLISRSISKMSTMVKEDEHLKPAVFTPLAELDQSIENMSPIRASSSRKSMIGPIESTPVRPNIISVEQEPRNESDAATNDQAIHSSGKKTTYYSETSPATSSPTTNTPRTRRASKFESPIANSLLADVQLGSSIQTTASVSKSDLTVPSNSRPHNESSNSVYHEQNQQDTSLRESEHFTPLSQRSYIVSGNITDSSSVSTPQHSHGRTSCSTRRSTIGAQDTNDVDENAKVQILQRENAHLQESIDIPHDVLNSEHKLFTPAKETTAVESTADAPRDDKCVSTPALDTVFKTPRSIRYTRTSLAAVKRTPTSTVKKMELQTSVASGTDEQETRSSSFAELDADDSYNQGHKLSISHNTNDRRSTRFSTSTIVNSPLAEAKAGCSPRTPFAIEETPIKSVAPSTGESDVSRNTSSADVCPELLKHLCERVITLEHELETLADVSNDNITSSIDVTAANCTNPLSVSKLLETPAATSSIKKAQTNVTAQRQKLQRNLALDLSSFNQSTPNTTAELESDVQSPKTPTVISATKQSATRTTSNTSVKFEGVEELFKTPAAISSTSNKARNTSVSYMQEQTRRIRPSHLEGVQRLFKTPVASSSSTNDTFSLECVQQLFKTPSPNSSVKTLKPLTSPDSMEVLEPTTRGAKKVGDFSKSPIGNSSNLEGVEQMFKTPNASSSTRKNLRSITTESRLKLDESSDYEGIQKMLLTPVPSISKHRASRSSRNISAGNSSINLEDLDHLMKTPTGTPGPSKDVQKILKSTLTTMKLDMTDIDTSSSRLEGIQRLLQSPVPTTDKIIDSEGLQQSLNTPYDTSLAEKVDIEKSSCLEDIQQLFKTPNAASVVKRKGRSVVKSVKSVCNLDESAALDGISNLMKTPEISSALKKPMEEAHPSKLKNTSPNNTVNMEGLQRLLETPTDTEEKQISTSALRNDTSIAEGTQKLSETPISTRSSKSKQNDSIANFEGIQSMFSTPIALSNTARTEPTLNSDVNELDQNSFQSSSVSVVTNESVRIESIEKILDSSVVVSRDQTLLKRALINRIRVTPSNTSTNMEGIQQLLATPIEISSSNNQKPSQDALNDSKLEGIQQLLLTPALASAKKVDVNDSPTSTPTNTRLRRKLYTKNDPEDRTPESIKSPEVHVVSSRDYLNILDPISAKDNSKLAKKTTKPTESDSASNNSESTVSEPIRKNPSRVSKKNKSLAEEALAGASPEVKFVKPKKLKIAEEPLPIAPIEIMPPPYADSQDSQFRRKVMFNENLQIKEIYSPAPVGDIILKAPRGRGRNAQKEVRVIVEEPSEQPTIKPARRTARQYGDKQPSAEFVDELEKVTTVAEHPRRGIKRVKIHNDDINPQLAATTDSTVDRKNEQATDFAVPEVLDKSEAEPVMKRSRRAVAKSKPDSKKTSTKSNQLDIVAVMDVGAHNNEAAVASDKADVPVNQEQSNATSNSTPELSRSEPQENITSSNESKHDDQSATKPATNGSDNEQITEPLSVRGKRGAKKTSTKSNRTKPSKKDTHESPAAAVGTAAEIGTSQQELPVTTNTQAQMEADHSVAQPVPEKVAPGRAKRTAVAKTQQRRAAASRTQSSDAMPSSTSVPIQEEHIPSTPILQSPITKTPVVEQAAADSTSHDEPDPIPVKRGRGRGTRTTVPKTTDEPTTSMKEATPMLPPPTVAIIPQQNETSEKLTSKLAPASKGRKKLVAQVEHQSEIQTTEETLNESNMVKTILPVTHTSTPLMEINEEKPKATRGGTQKHANPTVAALIAEQSTPNRRSPRVRQADIQSSTQNSHIVINKEEPVIKRSRTRTVSKLNLNDDSKDHPFTGDTITPATERSTEDDKSKLKKPSKAPSKRGRGKTNLIETEEEVVKAPQKRSRRAPAKLQMADPDDVLNLSDNSKAHQSIRENTITGLNQSTEDEKSKVKKPTQGRTRRGRGKTDLTETEEEVVREAPKRARRVPAKLQMANPDPVPSSNDTNTETHTVVGNSSTSVIEQSSEDDKSKLKKPSRVPARRGRGKADLIETEEEVVEEAPKRIRRVPLKLQMAESEPVSSSNNTNIETVKPDPQLLSMHSQRGETPTKVAESNDDSNVEQKMPSKSRKPATKRLATRKKAAHIEDEEEEEVKADSALQQKEENTTASTSRRRPLRSRK